MKRRIELMLALPMTALDRMAAERLLSGNVAIALLANTLATVGGLYILIEVFGPVSGAHFNPAVSAVMRFVGNCRPHCLHRMSSRSCSARRSAPCSRMRCST